LVEFSVDQTCEISARASVKGSNASSEQEFAPAQDMSDSVIAKVLADAESTRVTDDAELRQIEAKNRANTLIGKAEQELKASSNRKLSEAVAVLGLALASGDSDSIREKSDLLESAITSNFKDFNDIFSNFGNIFGTPTISQSKKGTPQQKRPTPPSQGITTAPPAQVLGRIFGGGTFIWTHNCVLY
jgi:molecular chaperone DnaK (HSP70)